MTDSLASRHDLAELRASSPTRGTAADYILRMPKLSLHDHLDGGLRIATILELARKNNVQLPATTADELHEWVSLRSNAGSLVEYLKVDQITSAVLQTSEALTRVARERVIDLANENVLYAELRWAPEETSYRGLQPRDAVAAVWAGIREGEKEANRAGRTIMARQIICGLRHTTRTYEMALLAVACRSQGVVGYDLAGPEKGYPPSLHTRTFRYLAEQLFPVTIHAGEADGVRSIEDALVTGRALRIGHGVRLAEDFGPSDRHGGSGGLGRIAQTVLDRRIVLEICPTSNLQTGATLGWGTELSCHPFDDLYRRGFLVTVSPDNTLNSDTSVSQELARLQRCFGYLAEDLNAFQLNAIEGAFMSQAERAELRQEVQHLSRNLFPFSRDTGSVSAH